MLKLLIHLMDEMFCISFSNRFLIFQMIKREVLGRYKTSMFGLMWSIVTPLIMLLIYIFVFSVIFKSRWGENTNSLDFAGILFTGLIIYQFFSECMNRAPLLIIENINYVKKIVFPVEILPWVAMGSALFHFMVSIFVLIVYILVVQGGIEWTAFLLPVVLLPFVFLVIGLMWILAPIGVYVRDVAQFVGLITMGMMFLSPVLYPASAFPESYEIIFYLNPLTFVIEQSRNVLLWGEWPDFYGLGIYYMISICFVVVGFAWFRKTRQGFSDVL